MFMSENPVLDFNSATTAEQVLAAITEHKATLLDNAGQAEYAYIPSPSGRQTAVADGILEIRTYFGDFTEATLAQAVAHQVNVEYNKQVFIDDINTARGDEAAADLAEILLAQVGTLNDQRQALIAEWGAVENNAPLAARVAELKADPYTIILKALDARLDDADGDAFLAELTAKFLADRGEASYFGVWTLLNELDKAGDAVDPVYAFNSATTSAEILAAITTHGADLLDLDSQAEYAFIPSPSGRQTAIADGLLEIKKFFGDFTEATLAAALDQQVNVEYNKYVFIRTIDNARTEEAADIIAGELTQQVEVLNDQRQALIEEWGAIANNAPLAARVAELKADSYTIILKALDARLDDADAADFLAELSAQFVATRGNANYNGVWTLVDALDKAGDAVDAVYAFNSATTSAEILAAITTHGADLLDDASEAEYAHIPSPSGRQTAVANGVLEIKKFFGDFSTEEALVEALDHQVSVEYNKYVFIQAIDNAGDAAAMVKALKDYVGVLSEQRQDLIEEWGSVAGNAALAARVDELEADPYTIILKEVADRLNNPKFLQDLAAKLLVARSDAGGKFNGVVTIVDAIDGNMDITAPEAPAVALANDTGTTGDKITNDGELNLSAIEDGATVDYSIDGGQTWNTTFAAVEGQNTVHVRQTDAAGNVSTPSILTFTLDTTAPAAAAIAVAGAANGLNKTEATNAVAVTITPDVGATVISAKIGDEDLVEANGGYTFDATKLTEGEHTITVVTRDAAGNETTTTQKVTIDTVVLAPAVALANDTGAAGDKITNDGELAITGLEAGATVEYSTDGATWSSSFEAEEGQNTVHVRQTDAAGNVSEATTFTFTLDTAAPNVPSPLALAENADGTTAPVTVAMLNPEEGETFTITGGDDQALFNIVDGNLVYVGGPLDFESESDQKSFVLLITAEDATGNIEEREVTVNLTNVNEAPVAAATGNSASGNEDTVITGSVPAGSDVDDGDSLKYELVAPVAGLTLKADGTFSYVPPADFNGPVEFQYRVVDTAGAKSAPQTFELTINAVNDAPRDILLSKNAVTENSVAGTEIGKLTASDPEGGTFTYALLDNASGRFAVDAATGLLTVARNFALDYEQATSHTIRVQVKDSAGATYVETLTIDVGDVSGEKVTGTSTSDVLTGNAGNDVFKAGAGNDTVAGGAGNDMLYGGTGNDNIRGGIGKDTLKGESGKDTFVFDTVASKSNVDKVLDFIVKDDSFWLDNAVFTKLGKKGTEASPAKLSKSFFTIGDKAKDKNDYVIYDDKKGKLFYDADGSGKGKQVEIATLSKNLKLTEKDFFIV